MGFFGSSDPVVGEVQFSVDEYAQADSISDASDPMLLLMFPYYIVRMVYNLGADNQLGMWISFHEMIKGGTYGVGREPGPNFAWDFRVPATTHLFAFGGKIWQNRTSRQMFHCRALLRRGRAGLYIETKVSNARLPNDKIERYGRQSIECFYNLLIGRRGGMSLLAVYIVDSMLYLVRRSGADWNRLGLNHLADLPAMSMRMALERVRADSARPEAWGHVGSPSTYVEAVMMAGEVEKLFIG